MTPSLTRRTALGLLGAAAIAPEAISAPATSGRPRYHIAAPPGGWINDPQRPIKIDGVWNLWALFNPTYPSKGTEWRRWTSTDLVTWTDRGVSIPRHTTPFGDLWTGSTVVDRHGTAGFGAGALIAIVTMPAPDGDGQNQSCALWYSLDGGASFRFHAIVLADVPGHTDFRDPSVFWHAPTGNWVLTLSRRGQVSFYASSDLRRWRYLSGFRSSIVGDVMECSQFFRLHLHGTDGRPSGEKWVLVVGGNGSESGQTIGTYYWVGDFDGTVFTAMTREGQWLDHGADFYATTVWTDPDASDPEASAYAIGWQQNWSYAGNYPALNGYRGQLSLVRRITLRQVGHGARLFSEPLAQQNELFAKPAHGRDQTIGDGLEYLWPVLPRSPACRIDLTLSRIGSTWPESVVLSVRSNADYATHIRFWPTQNRAALSRDRSGPKPTASRHWTDARIVPCDFTGGSAKLTAFVDVSSVELFLNDGAASASSLITAPLDATGVALIVSGGSVRVTDVAVYDSA